MARIENIGCATLILGDCLTEGMALLPELCNVADASVVADPPYGIPIMTEFADVKRSKAAAATGKNFKAVIGNDKPFDPTPWLIGKDQLFWGANHFAHALPHNGRWLCWDKRCDIIPPRTQADFELAWCSDYGAGRMFYHMWDGMVKASEMGEARVHPTQKPIELMSWCLQFAKGSVIIDPYMGSGTTGVAAVKAGKRFIGMELDEDYFAAACKRIKDADAQPDLFVRSA